MDNGYQEREQQERDRANADSISFLVIEMRAAIIALNDMKKEVRKIREELRNLDKLRPLRSKSESDK